MCGRYTRYLPWSEIHRLYRLTLDWEKQRNDAPAYNVAPTEEVPFVTIAEDGNHKLRQGRWWLVPYWAKEVPKFQMFNARSEEADAKPAFRDAFKSKRCLVPADGFYEWTKSPADGGRDPWYIFLADHRPFSFAGLWAYNSTLDITSCTILTAPAENPMSNLHDRQPVILDATAYDAWLDPATPVSEAKALLSQNLDSDLQFYRVDRQVNSSKFKGGEEMIKPIDMASEYGLFPK
ncbi:SOS response-associated peptidase [Mesorhizobium sp. P16.1]|uniref:SOS response-associated peptidase n=1 Tax=unclassified Mesorhizobium TaxID=325217 RepID=UPI0021A3E894|nr:MULTISPECIES: SOS response-associated peptidase [unclassified Mesorhizobium]MCT2580959.1 SOS response-associated peptidase [Mesorhizobium sp. P13.3]MDF3169982.1 SOS response-associated peptidase [Mesorhizobium sp. P16.1]MDF3181194.1 SOS response-associated peptidase [Mesorhizobium sp. P17.1]MDF3186861.1 SOS response-associated peptidase [Mesorhizobium sp. ICCV3110.1]